MELDHMWLVEVVVGCRGMVVVVVIVCPLRDLCYGCVCGFFPLSSRLPLHPWPCAGSSLFQETQCGCDSFCVIEELCEVSGAAISSEVLVARGGIIGEFEQQVLNCLYRFPTWACDLFRCVLVVEALGICSYKGMSCN